MPTSTNVSEPETNTPSEIFFPLHLFQFQLSSCKIDLGRITVAGILPGILPVVGTFQQDILEV